MGPEPELEPELEPEQERGRRPGAADARSKSEVMMVTIMVMAELKVSVFILKVGVNSLRYWRLMK